MRHTNYICKKKKEMETLIDELKWRGLYANAIENTDEHLAGGKRVVYIGFDPTAPSLGIGNLVQVILLKHFQNAGHQPIALVGGATGMIGDPSGKSTERNLQTTEQAEQNIAVIRAQLKRFLNFDGDNPALLVNNKDWYAEMSILDFLRDVGKLLTVNYMAAKDSVKSRMETGISFTEFSYQLLQGYDFHVLNEKYNCSIQLGGSDQWGNITTGIEMVRKISGKQVFGITSPLVTKADGTKFGKSEKGNIYIHKSMTSPYAFYQFWINCSDEDARNFIKIFTFRGKEEIEGLISEHDLAPHKRLLQNILAEDLTLMVHSQEDLELAKKASTILFGKGTRTTFEGINEDFLDEIFVGVPKFEVSRTDLEDGIPLLEFLTSKTSIFASNGEVRRTIKGNALLINKERVQEEQLVINSGYLMNNRYLIVQNGKKKYYIVRAI